MHRIDEGLFARRPEPMGLGYAAAQRSSRQSTDDDVVSLISVYRSGRGDGDLQRRSVPDVPITRPRPRRVWSVPRATDALSAARRSSKVFACDPPR
jgi:hypothetical protein